jgi:hypothetical protein
MTPERFRFRPPAVEPPAALAWVLLRAFGPGGSAAAPADPVAAAELAERLGLLPRIAARLDLAEAAAELGAAATERLRRERALAAARDLRFDETLHPVAEAAAGLGFAPIVLKGRALAAGGYSGPLTRPSQDLDLLVPRESLAPLRSALIARGFLEAPGSGYEHHPPALRHPLGETVELHRHLPGVRLDGADSAGWRELVAAGLAAAPRSSATEPAPCLLVPAREVLIAHALVHALAQHGLSTGYAGWLLVGDLIDLAAGSGETPRPRWLDWIRRDLSFDEASAALELAACLGRGENPFAGAAPEPVLLLARHLLAGALDADYAWALKARWLEAPVSDRTPLGARLRLLGRAFVPPRRITPAGEPESRVRRAARWLGRPFELAKRALRARLAALRRR